MSEVYTGSEYFSVIKPKTADENKIIANQRGVSIDELSVKEGVTSNVATPTANVMTDDQIASKMRCDADRLYKEAARLRK